MSRLVFATEAADPETGHCYGGIVMKPVIAFDFIPPQRDEVECNQSLPTSALHPGIVEGEGLLFPQHPALPRYRLHTSILQALTFFAQRSDGGGVWL
eukprot:gene4937-biopygen1628